MNKMPTKFFIEWWFPATYFTHAIVIKKKVFPTRKERENYIINRKRKWWEYLPFIEKVYYID